MLPERFPDGETERLSLIQRLLMQECDELLEPESEPVQQNRAVLNDELRERIRPPELSGKHSQLSAIRRGYVESKIALQLEGLPVSDATPALDFWQYVEAIESKYKRHQTKPRDAAEPL